MDYFSVLDSPNFCNAVSGNLQADLLPLFSSLSPVTASQPYNYQCLISLIYKACLAAGAGDLVTLTKLENKTDFDFGDYDQRSPLYFAVRNNQYNTTLYLLQQGVNVNRTDRWGGTALNYAINGSAV